jgi:hypothetical protein
LQHFWFGVIKFAISEEESRKWQSYAVHAMAKTGQQTEEKPSSSSASSRIVYVFVGATVVPFAAAISSIMTEPNKHLSTQQRNQDILSFVAVGLSAAAGLAAYLYFDNKRKLAKSDGRGERENESSKKTAGGNGRVKDIWKVGQSSRTSLKKRKEAYVGKKFGSKYYYAHNDSNTTGGYKDGLKMEDYRMNGPRLLSVNGQSVHDNDQSNNGCDGKEEEIVAGVSANSENDGALPSKITAQDPDVKNITKYLWDDPGNGKGIATIRVDVLPGEKFGEFVDFGDVDVKNVTASLPGEGLLAKIVVSDKETPSYQLKINKLYGDAADVKVIVKPKRLLIKVYKKKHGFLSRNDNNLDAWPQPHRKI